ncbi:hypothetical protein CROQUDRAFT_664651 [Cronartium quercuum f. sp. fusiforme G11]|uniref:Histone-lysine N-methyltransferase, H3 lysine-79 specific n=1 Tax=Cronartium quercuum f. sp. fusiforme G11 TaxID=708437 RepID=A0A9P6NBQ6_9BASI|nr:hypothetical protein CROQUDRAFT_664651 [Cronartium quercuum f. sp. fusiforme G11]
MDFFADPRLKNKKTTTTTTTTTTNTPRPPQPQTTIKVRTVPGTVGASSAHTPALIRLQKHSTPVQRFPQTSSPLASSASRNVTSVQQKSNVPKQPKPQPLKKQTEAKKPAPKRRADLPAARPIKKARWTGGLNTKARLPDRLLNSVEPDSCSSLVSDDRSECVSTAADPESTDDEEKETQTRILDRYNRIVPRNVRRPTSGFSSTHPFLSDRSQIGTTTSSDSLVKQNRGRFKQWFRPGDGHWPFREGEDPKVELVYPAGGQEVFPLLVPKEKEDEYRPLDDILNVITTSLGQYLTPQQSVQFFSEPHPIFAPSSTATNSTQDFRFLNRPSSARPIRSSPDPAITEDERPRSSDLSFLAGEPDLSRLPLIKSLSKAIRRQNGSEFIKLVKWYNRVMRHLISQGSIEEQIERMKGLKMNIWEIILGQAYERQIGPRIEMVKQYATWSSNVYGELRPKFVSDLIHLAGLKPGQVFVDLGSGVGNIVMQVVLEAGCVGVGFENMSSCCKLADGQMREVIGRCQKFWGVSLGQPLLLEADFTTDGRVGQWLKQADVVLVNNQVFTPALNESLTLLFLDLKDSVKIISLKPFVSKEFKISERNMNSPLAILNQAREFSYGSASVSWTDSGGKFYLTEVDRSRLVEFQRKSAVDHRT